MSSAKIQSGQTDEIQWSPLSMLSLEMHLPQAPQFNTPVLRPWLWNISWYNDYEKASFWAKTGSVALWQIKWNPKDMKSKLSPSFTLSTPLESKQPTLPSAQLFPLELQDQIKFPRISQLEYLRGHQKHTPSQRQSFHNPAGTWLARFVSWCVCHLLSWN